METLQGKMVIVGISGGIAAYKSCELVRLLTKAGAEVQVIMTEAAAQLVGPLTFQALSGRPVEVGHGGRLASAGMDHIDLGRDADCIVVAPCTANTMAKMAAGMADNLLTNCVLASTCPVVVAPAMNTRMWQNNMTRKNARTINADKRFSLVGPDDGDLACGESGAGRMVQPEKIFVEVERSLGPWDLRGFTILVTAGPTREQLDPVRFLSNRSSGKMGYALARAAYSRGAEVVLISGPVCLDSPHGVKIVRVESAAQMARAVAEHSVKSHGIIMAAAVADFRPSKKSRSKIKKAKDSMPCSWTRTDDILASLGRRFKGKKKRALLVGFAAETGDPLPSAAKKLKTKGLDLVVANDVSKPDAGFEVDTNIIHLVEKQSITSLELMSKQKAAHEILDRVALLLKS